MQSFKRGIVVTMELWARNIINYYLVYITTIFEYRDSDKQLFFLYTYIILVYNILNINIILTRAEEIT